MGDVVTAFLDRLRWGLADPFRDAAFDAMGKLWWPYVITGLVIAWLAHRLNPDGRRYWAILLDRETWLSRSARADYVVALLNPVLQVTLLAALAVNYRDVAAFITEALRWLGVRGEITGGWAIVAGLALTAALFLADDFTRWWTHWLQHRSRVLWEFHKVHHSAEVLNFVTLHRHHPLDPIVTTFSVGLTTAAVNSLFFALLGDQLTVATVAGANVLRVVFNALGGVLRHGPFWVSFGPRFERWIASPALHHIHHSADPRHWDTNFGTSLSVWDRWAGTLHIPKGREVTAFGIGEAAERHHSLGGLYVAPFARAARLLRKGQ